jgi:ribosomal-protein-alanine N-acetyltransferase
LTELRTQRLRLTGVAFDDDAFVLELLNDPGWLENIGDRGVRTIADARTYIRERFWASPWFVVRDEAGDRLGMCGLVDREGLEHHDIGYAFLACHSGKGYATEAARAVLRHGLESLGHATILAVTKPHNTPSQRVLEKIGLRRVGTVVLPGNEHSSVLFST